MNTYYDTASFEIALPRDLAADGPDRFSLGVCPGCYNSSAADVAHRMGLATTLGVWHVSWWAGPSPEQTVWWAAVRKWKQLA